MKENNSPNVTKTVNSVGKLVAGAMFMAGYSVFNGFGYEGGGLFISVGERASVLCQVSIFWPLWSGGISLAMGPGFSVPTCGIVVCWPLWDGGIF